MTTTDDTPSSPPLVLASASPRRRELLAYLGVPFRIIATDAEEYEHDPPAEIVAALPPLALPLFDHPTLRAWRKAHAACSLAPDSVIIGADTIVALKAQYSINRSIPTMHVRCCVASRERRIPSIPVWQSSMHGAQTHRRCSISSPVSEHRSAE
jgi:Nucleotide-binding protein implicated in inhibition of septum formation